MWHGRQNRMLGFKDTNIAQGVHWTQKRCVITSMDQRLSHLRRFRQGGIHMEPLCVQEDISTEGTSTLFNWCEST